jgi:hypothetical protein
MTDFNVHGVQYSCMSLVNALTRADVHGAPFEDDSAAHGLMVNAHIADAEAAAAKLMRDLPHSVAFAAAREAFRHLSDGDWMRLVLEYGPVQFGPGLADVVGPTPDQTAIGIDPAFFDDGEPA